MDGRHYKNPPSLTPKPTPDVGDDPMFSSRTGPELLRAIQGMMTEARNLGVPVTTTIETGSREKTYGHPTLVKEAWRIHAAIEKFRAGLDAGDDPRVPRMPPGLRRLRASPQAERIRQSTLADNRGARQDAARRMRESKMNEATVEGGAPASKKKSTKKTAKSAAKKTAKTVAKKTKKAKAASERAPRMKFGDDQVIKVGKALAEKNPRRTGSAAHERLELVRKHDGKTVKAFKAKGGREATLSGAVKNYGTTVK